MAIKHFVDQFHSLSGKTVGEKLKSLNQLISDVRSNCAQHEIDQFITEVKPTNNFEKLLKGRLIDSFKKSQDVLDVLRCEDRLFIKQVLGCGWFFEGSSPDFPTCEFFITDVFPNTTFNTRNDIIHLLSVHLRDERVAEQFFSAVRNEFGFQQAKPLLCACGAHFIQSVLDTDEAQFVFTEREVSRLVRKHTDLVELNIKKKCFSRHFSKILEIILDIDVNKFIKLFEVSQYIPLEVGRRGSKKIIRSNPAAVIKSAQKYIKILKPRYLYKYLTTENFTQFYIALFPGSHKGVYFFEEGGYFYTVVEVLPERKRLEMLLECFERVYDEQLLDQTHLVREKLLLLLPPEKREMCAQKKIELCLSKDEDETYWICYLTIEKSIPMLKKLLVEAPDLNERCQIISYLILTCKVNEDLEALASVCEHVVARYRNDDLSLRSKILTELDEKFDLMKLDDRNWKSVLEIIKIIFLNQEQFKMWQLGDILTKTVHYRLINQADIVEQIDQFIILICSSYSWDSWVVLRKEPKYQRVIFEAFAERIPQVKKVKTPLTDVVIHLLRSLSGWNKINDSYKFSLCKFSWAVGCLREIVDKNLDGNREEALECLKYDLETKQLVCPEHEFKEEVVKDLKYFLKLDNELFIQNADDQLQYLLNTRAEAYKHLFRTWNLRSFSPVREVVVQKCCQIFKNDLENEEKTQELDNAIMLLSYLMEEDSFTHFIKPFLPTVDKIDLSDEKTLKFLQLTKRSALCLKNVNPWNNYSTIAQFCKGDYLKYILGSLTSVCFNSVQKKIEPFLKGLTNSPVSVKKHAMKLSFKIVGRAKLLPLLTSLWNADKNPATREVILELVWRAFSEPSPDMFELLKYCLKSIRVDDKNMFSKLSSDPRFPDKYKAEYMELCWDKLHELLQQGAKTKPLIAELISRFGYMVELLPSSFCDRVIKQYMCKDSAHKEACMTFAVTYILKSDTQNVLNERFKIILGGFENLTRHCTSGRNDIALFINSLCQDVLVYSYKMVPQVLHKFLSICPSVLNPIHKFETFILLNFTSLYFSCMPNINLVNFGKISSEYVSTVMEEYSLGAITLVSKTFDDFIKSVEIWNREESEKQETRLHVIAGLLTEPVPLHAYIIAAHLIPQDFASIAAVKHRYIEIIQTIFKVDNKVVCLIINSLPVFENNLELLDCEMVSGPK